MMETGSLPSTSSLGNSRQLVNDLINSNDLLNKANTVTMENCKLNFITTEDNVQTLNGDGIRVELQGRHLWRQFYDLGTEMIITKIGRRMFPAIRLKVYGLQPMKKYHMVMDVLPVDDSRYRYVYHNSRWMVAGTGDSPLPSRAFVHPESPCIGDQWARQIISFDKMKLTNHENDQAGHIILHSMHKYQPRLHIIEHVEGPEQIRVNSLEPVPVGHPLVHTFIFQETSFITVTAYQNQQITRLKIERNPFAKGFRNSGRNKNSNYDPASDVRITGIDTASSRGLEKLNLMREANSLSHLENLHAETLGMGSLNQISNLTRLQNAYKNSQQLPGTNFLPTAPGSTAWLNTVNNNDLVSLTSSAAAYSQIPTPISTYNLDNQLLNTAQNNETVLTSLTPQARAAAMSSLANSSAAGLPNNMAAVAKNASVGNLILPPLSAITENTAAQRYMLTAAQTDLQMQAQLNAIANAQVQNSLINRNLNEQRLQELNLQSNLPLPDQNNPHNAN